VISCEISKLIFVHQNENWLEIYIFNTALIKPWCLSHAKFSTFSACRFVRWSFQAVKTWLLLLWEQLLMMSGFTKSLNWR